MVRPSSIVLPGALLVVVFLHLDASPTSRLSGPAATAQEAQETRLRDVISKQIGVSADEASLTLEMEDGSTLDVAFRGGDVIVDGERIGGYSPGGPLEGAWRTLLGQVLALDNGPLARALVDWSPPAASGPAGGAQSLGNLLDQALETGLTVQTTPAPDEPAIGAQAAGGAPITVQSDGSIVDLLRRAELLALLGEAAEGVSLDGGARLVVGRNVTVGSDEVVQGSLIVVDGDATIEGTVRGDVVVTEGRLSVLEGGSVGGDVRLAGAELSLGGGRVSGSVIEVSAARTRALRNLSRLQGIDDLGELEELDGLIDVDELLEEIRADVRRDLRREGFRSEFGNGGSSVFGSFARGIGGLIQNVVGFLILLVLAGAAVRFFPDHVRRVERAVEASPVRSGVVGIAGLFLLVPVWILGMVALVVSLVGIPALIAWIPLFPLAAALAVLLGYLAAAILVGRWIIDQDFQNLDFLRRSNPIHAAAAGLAGLMIPYVVGNVLHFAGGWLDGLGNLITAVGGLAGVAVAILGFGAVLLTRGGRRPLVPEPWPPAPEWDDEPWQDEWSDLESSPSSPPSGESGSATEAEDDSPDGEPEQEEDA